MAIINHDLRCVDGKTIYSLPEIGGSTTQGNLALPNIYSESATALYPVGTKFVDGQRVFHYAYAATALQTLKAVVGYDAVEIQSVATYDTEEVAGSATLRIDGTSAGVPAKNAYAGMFITIYTSEAANFGRPTMRIVSNTAGVTDSPYTMTLTLDQPLPFAVAANTTCDVFPNRYADIRLPTGLTAGMYPFLGLAMILVTAARYFWLQTWGPCFVTSNSTEPGDVAYDRIVTFRSDGSLGLLDEDVHTNQYNNQIAGFTLATNGSASEWIMLQLDR